jgi:hypothetical protein
MREMKEVATLHYLKRGQITGPFLIVANICYNFLKSLLIGFIQAIGHISDIY